ncbi:MAG: hypothetical protein ABR874_04795 [Candidatus Sulfotelmatobacter sp.]|jgi:hypothetical protein
MLPRGLKPAFLSTRYAALKRRSSTLSLTALQITTLSLTALQITTLQLATLRLTTLQLTTLQPTVESVFGALAA